jgi:hypothetical protein
MSPRKLSDDDREEILSLYRNTEETTSTLAVRFGVSSSTVSRFLKNSLSELEYEDLIQKKRLARTSNTSQTFNLDSTQSSKPKTAKGDNSAKKEKDRLVPHTPTQTSLELGEESSTKEEISTPEIEAAAEKKPSLSRSVFDSVEPETTLEKEKKLARQQDQEKLVDLIPEKPKPILQKKKDDLDTVQEDQDTLKDKDEEKTKSGLYFDDDMGEFLAVNVYAEMYGEDVEDIGDDEDDEDDEDWDEEEITPTKEPVIPNQISILPLSEASFPHHCYLVIDRSAELVTRPLREFAELGKIPQEELQEKTLPVFDNHRVAKRFCNRRGKVVKLPDTQILQKTSSFLKAKGITRMLIDGRIYSLSSELV